MSRAGLTAVTQGDKSLLHIYYQKHDSSVSVLYREDTAIGTQGNWNGGDATTIVPAGKAAYNTPLAAVHWRGTDDRDFYRIFYLDADNVLSVRALSTGGDWKDGNLQDLKIKCAHDTKIAATCSSTRGQLAISVIYQTSEGCLREVQYRNGWQQPEMLPVTAALFVNTSKTRMRSRLQ